jgi:hypothetical protein
MSAVGKETTVCLFPKVEEPEINVEVACVLQELPKVDVALLIAIEKNYTINVECK